MVSSEFGGLVPSISLGVFFGRTLASGRRKNLCVGNGMIYDGIKK